MSAAGPVADLGRETGARLGGGQPPRLSPDLVGDGLAQLAARGQEVGDGRLRSLIDGKNDQIPVMGDTDVEGPDLLLSSRDELFDRDALTPGGQPQNQRHVGRQRGRVAGSQSLLSECGGPGRFGACTATILETSTMIRPPRSIPWRALTPTVAVAGLQLATGALGAASPAATPAQSPHGVDLAGIDRLVAPGDDFFRYANGAWLKATEIPPDRSSYGPGEQLTELTAERTAELVRNTAGAPAGSEARKIGDYYASFMDEEAIEKRGLEPLQPALRSIDAVKDRAGL